MSDSSLSDALTDIEAPISYEELSLPPLNTSISPLSTSRTPVNLQLPPRRSLPVTKTSLFSAKLYSRLLLETEPSTIQYECLQPSCGYKPPPQLATQNSTGNLWLHYKRKHPALEQLHNNKNSNIAISSASSSNSSSFFEPRQLLKPTLKPALHQAKYRELLIQFIVSNNLSLSIVESYTYRQLIHFLSPTTLSISTTTVSRELLRQFSYYRGQLITELDSHIKNGGRISITTDAWSARNYTQFAAVTGHWINDKWQQRSVLLDVIHLKEPIHSGEYLAEELQTVTDGLGITRAVFTCTRDNASVNNVMLSEFEKLAQAYPTSSQQPWTFTVKEGDVRCIAHIINLAVQATLKALKADPSAEINDYRCELGAARIPHTVESNTEIMITLAKLRRHIYVFRNRRQWSDALRRQTLAASLKPRQLTLDMLIRWNSTYHMLTTAKYLRDPITAVCATQTLDLSMREIALTLEDWVIIQGLEDLFKIFLSPSQKMQASTYPTLNFVIPKYLKMIERLKMTIQAVGNQTTIGLACTAALLKLNQYYTLTTSQRYSHSAVATVCDPRMNLAVFQRLWPTSINNVKRDQVLAQFRAVYNQYNSREYQLNKERIEQQIQLEVEEQLDPDSDDDLYVTTATSYQEPEWKRWNNEGCPGPQTDILKYWAAKQYQYPVIAKIARDHLAIPATSAASERVFSNGSDIITKKRNRLSPSTVRYLLCLRDWGHLPEADDSDADDEREE
jgi:hypothetical protein